jgi:hypothetical protein
MTDNVIWYQFHVNPEPWAVGPVSVGRKAGKMIPIVGRNQQMEAYKEAIREEFAMRYPGDKILPGQYSLDFFFWRRLDAGVTAGRDRRQHQADGTNLMKATEDALQGLIIDNDRNVMRSAWTIVSQGPGVAPGALVRVQYGLNALEALAHLPWEMQEEILTYRHLAVVPDEPVADNSWPPKEGL